MASPSRRPWYHFGFPALVGIGVALVAALTQFWPGAWETASRNTTLLLTLLIGTFLMGLWLLFFSPLPRSVRILGTLALLAALIGSGRLVRQVHFDGDMWPSFEFVWSPTADDQIESHRASQKVPRNETATRTTEDSFPGYLGPQRDGVVPGWQLNPEELSRTTQAIWKQPVGAGYSGFAIHGPRAVTLEQRRDEEALVCYDTETGAELWTHRWPGHFQETMGGPGPRATPGIVPGTTPGVVALGALGKLVCVDLASGTERWHAEILQDNENLAWAMAGSPLVAEGLVIVAPGVQTASAKGRGLLAFDAGSGKPIWATGDSRGAYSSPMVATLCGQKQILQLDADGLHAYDPASGKSLWFHEWITFAPQFINVAQPLVLEGDRVFVASGYNKGCAMLQVENKSGTLGPRVLWENTSMRCKFTSPVAHKGHLYGLDEGILTCLDASTGERRWKDGRYGHGQVLLVGDHLLILSEKGQLAVVEANPERYREAGSFAALRGKTWNPPAIAGGKAFVRNHVEMACYPLPAKRGP